MEIQTDTDTGAIIPTGKIDSHTSQELDRVLRQFSNEGRDLIIDMSGCNYLSSAGIRVLLQTAKQLNTSGKTLYLTSVPDQVMQILEMAGLQTVFQIKSTVKEAHDLIFHNTVQTSDSGTFRKEGLDWHFTLEVKEAGFCKAWKSSGIVDIQELGLCAGVGLPADLAMDETSPEANTGSFFCTGRSLFYASNPECGEWDFRAIADPLRFGIRIQQAVSFPSQPFGILTCKDHIPVQFEQIVAAIIELKERCKDQKAPFMTMVVNWHPDNPCIAFLLFQADNQTDEKRENTNTYHQSDNKRYTGISIRLEQIPPELQDQKRFRQFESVLNYENILDVKPLDSSATYFSPLAFVFTGQAASQISAHRIQVVTTGEFKLSDTQIFLARRLYQDASKVIVTPLHGGYSAQTFHVSSHDPEGRLMGPTVMKVSGKNLISRESERCRKYALPFIFNNSAVVQGTEFFGETGALRYNFVGIGGEETRLKWLTHWFHDESFEVLSPIFDKIFLKILKPWYGQPLAETIFPFRDHDPTFTFFPFIYDTVKDVFGFSPEDQQVQCTATGRSLLNPYWYLKYEYARLRDFSMDYFTGICHGDLNMQNILLDEKMNVYLIDFSETRPRAVVSDFARLEAIFMIDNAPVETEEDLARYLPVLEAFYHGAPLNDVDLQEFVSNIAGDEAKNLALTMKMREYALQSTGQMADPLPYYVALLEWVLPVVCYSTLPLLRRRVSMVAASLLCEQLMLRLGSADA